jgi:hypothetical protein
MLHCVSPMQVSPALVVQAELISSSVWAVRHAPQGELAVSVEGSAHAPVHALAQGAFGMQPQSLSS